MTINQQNSIQQQELPNVYLLKCPSREVLTLIGEKWVSLILGALDERPLRFGELKRACDGVSQKMLTQTLRKLERNGLVVRTNLSSLNELRVEYSLSALGESLIEIINASQRWAETHLAEIEAQRLRYDATHG